MIGEGSVNVQSFRLNKQAKPGRLFESAALARKPLPWVRVIGSSNVKAIAYDAPESRMYIWFDPKRKGKTTGRQRIYEYLSVPYQTYYAFLRAASKGNYVWRVVRANGTDMKFIYLEVGRQ